MTFTNPPNPRNEKAFRHDPTDPPQSRPWSTKHVDNAPGLHGQRVRFSGIAGSEKSGQFGVFGRNPAAVFGNRSPFPSPDLPSFVEWAGTDFVRFVERGNTDLVGLFGIVALPFVEKGRRDRSTIRRRLFRRDRGALRRRLVRRGTVRALLGCWGRQVKTAIAIVWRAFSVMDDVSLLFAAPIPGNHRIGRLWVWLVLSAFGMTAECQSRWHAERNRRFFS